MSLNYAINFWDVCRMLKTRLNGLMSYLKKDFKAGILGAGSFSVLTLSNNQVVYVTL